MKEYNFSRIIELAWMDYDDSRSIKTISDISAKVSTNHVFRIELEDGGVVIGKLSYFGFYEHFLEDHEIINALSNNLTYPFHNLIGKSLHKGTDLYTFVYQKGILKAWVVFYNPISIGKKLPRRLELHHIEKLGEQMAQFHKMCTNVRNVLPKSSKTIFQDIQHLKDILATDQGKFEHRGNEKMILDQCDQLLSNLETINYQNFPLIPVFVDWNLGNFSVTNDCELYSRWDYDWFRTSSRVMDFYFFSRIVSDIGDRTEFSYLVHPLNENRFLTFLKSYHRIYPLTKDEVLFIKESYRFFLLNYVIKDGRYFFHHLYAVKLQQEAIEIYFPEIDQFNVEKILKALDL